MDNIEQSSSPSGEADVTASQGQLDATDTQTDETSQPIDGGVGAESGQASNPWDNDPKFKGKTPEDIYKAYSEVEKLNGQLSQKAQVANLIQEKYGVTPEQLRLQIEAQERQQKQELYANNPLAPLMDEVSELKAYKQAQEQEKALANVNSELDKYIKDNPGYETHRDKILKLALTPGIGFDQETGAETPIEDIAKDYFGTARAQGQQDAYKKIDKKIMTQATGAVSTPQKKLSMDDMQNMSVEELRAILPHAEGR